MKVGVVMPVINLWSKYTKHALDSLAVAINKAQTGDTYCEALLINNGSTDETHDAMMTTVWPDIREGWISYHKNEDMKWFQWSVNFGVKHFLDKGFDAVLVLNNDILLHPQSIARLIERLEKGGIGMVTCMNVRSEVDEQTLPEGLLTFDDASKEKVAEAPHPDFSAFMVTRECWEKIGEFDELFQPAYYEDNDYHYRMGLGGMLAIVYPPAVYYHYGSRTQNEAIGRPFTDSGGQYGRYLKKWSGAPGKEQWKTPYNDPAKSIRSTQQNPTA